MEFRLYFQMLRRGWWIVVLTALIALIVSLLASLLVTPKYRAVARFIISPTAVQATTPDLVLQGLNTLDKQSVMDTYAEVMNSSRIYEDSVAFLQLEPNDLKEYTHQAVVLPTATILELSVIGPDPQMAAKLANAIGFQTINFTNRLNQVINIDVLDSAIPPTVPYSPQPLRDAVLAMALGLIGGAVLAIVRDQLRLSVEAFQHRLHLDDETGVYNHDYFSQLLRQQLTQDPEGVLSIGIVELNGLRDFIETFPSATIQRVLQGVTNSLRRELRGNDVIGRWDHFSFSVMLPNTPGMAAQSIFNRIYQALTEPVNLSEFGTVINLDSHIGGAEYSGHISMQELLDKANSSLDQAHRSKDIPVYVWEIKNPFWKDKAAALK